MHASMIIFVGAFLRTHLAEGRHILGFFTLVLVFGMCVFFLFFFFSSRRRHTRCGRDWSSDVCSSDLRLYEEGLADTQVLDVILRTPRHLFVDEALAHRAYEDTALPIGHNQTISQPYIVARMTELLLGGGPLDKVLEVGTGSGYQTAILAQVVERVFTVERILPLQERGKAVLKDIDIRNVVFRHADGNWGWPQYGPYDAILVTAAPADVPAELLAQLADGGRLVIPVGEPEQFLTLVTRDGEHFIRQQVEPVRFVPLLSGVMNS